MENEITPEDIEVIAIKHGDGTTEVRASLKVTLTAKVDDRVYSYSTRDNIIKHMKEQLKNEMMHRIYGKVRQDSVDLYRTMQCLQSLSFDDYDNIYKKFQPLMDAGKDT